LCEIKANKIRPAPSKKSGAVKKPFAAIFHRGKKITRDKSRLPNGARPIKTTNKIKLLTSFSSA